MPVSTKIKVCFIIGSRDPLQIILPKTRTQRELAPLLLIIVTFMNQRGGCIEQRKGESLVPNSQLDGGVQ